MILVTGDLVWAPRIASGGVVRGVYGNAALAPVDPRDIAAISVRALLNRPPPTGYSIVEGHADGRFTARADLAASMLAVLDDDRYLRTTVSVVTAVDNPTLLQWIGHEALAAS
ncbi:hypothetical protein N5079_06310 [Planotetraspora sp. A-T 1434]|uniref:hypothetical protein n=1 Tax=Planotetraspora sp. A-T 1434 TaxID=2979219 RepID=UPI0021C0E809|nr:hypothetical protein [Planotetraspora sp. A-T 1434]MCT9929830.1 hypothetical protein [Planotetraspora sp. A-T 1434]